MGVDEKSINILVDLAVICNSDVVSSLKGELISSIDIENIPVVSKILCNKSSTTIFNQGDNHNIALHRDRITKKKDTLQREVENIFEDRIKLLSGNCVDVTLGNDLGDMAGILYDRLDFLIKLHSGLLRYGIIDITELDMFHLFRDMGIDNLPAHVVVNGYVCARDSLKLIEQTSHFIIKD